MSEGKVMSGGRSSALRKVVELAAALDLPAATDRELLRRFARENDQSAFEALVHRHTAMVFGVCRRTLPNVQDAEDACQATFLVLANRAKYGRWQESVANWLYSTARKVAHNARVAAERRVRRETGAAVPEAVEPVDRMTGRELLSALDGALDRLPPSYREPVVLCYLEGLTRDEAASRLGIPLATLHTRIDRARKRLHQILTKAGCTPGAGLLALAVTSPAGASPPRLVPSILAAAAGNVPAAVDALAKGVAVNGSYSKWVLALAAVVVAALGAALGAIDTNTAGSPSPGPAPERVDEPHPKNAAAKPAPKEVALTGRVLDPDGKPLVGAKLFARHLDELKEVGTSGADGKFAVKVPAGRATDLVARAEGVGLDFLPITPDRVGEEIELRTVKDHPVRGRVLDTQGKPVVGATVAVSEVDVGNDNSLEDFLAAVKRGLLATRGMSKTLREARVLPPVTTDKDGRFTIEGAGAERLVTLQIYGAGLAERRVPFVNRKDFDPKPYSGVKLAPAGGGGGGGGGGRQREGRVYYGPDGPIIFETEKLIRGTVTDAATGKPWAGARVSMGIKVTPVRDGLVDTVPRLSAVTDAQGKYVIHGIHKSASYAVEVDSDPVTRFHKTSVRVNDTAGFEPITVDFKVKKGVLVTGKVIDTGTKEVRSGFASVAIMLDNKFVKEYPEFHAELALIVSTGEDDIFRIVTVPGPVLLMGGTTAATSSEARKQTVRDELNRYKRAEPDPKYPQYFNAKYSASSGYPVYLSHEPDRLYGINPRQFCKVLEIKADAETVVQDILLEPAK